MITKKSFQDLKIIKTNMDEILGFINNKVIPTAVSFSTQQLSIFYPGLVTNLIIQEGTGEFSLEIGENAYNTFKSLSKLDTTMIELLEFTNVSGVDVYNSNVTASVYILASSPVVIGKSSLLYELYRIQNLGVYQRIEGFLRVTFLCALSLQFQLITALLPDSPEKVSMSAISSSEIEEIIKKLDYIINFLEMDNTNDIKSLLWELRKLYINLILLIKEL